MAETLTKEQMDAAADLFQAELDKLPQTVTVPLARLWKKHYLKAGHKRLGRVLVALAKATDKMKEKDFTTAEDMAILNEPVEHAAFGKKKADKKKPVKVEKKPAKKKK